MPLGRLWVMIFDIFWMFCTYNYMILQDIIVKELLDCT